MDDAPGLFEMPIEPLSPFGGPLPGRNRETWTCATTATVAVLDREMISDAFARLEETAIMIGEVDSEPDYSDLPTSALDQLAWLVWPTAGMDAALDADVFRVLSVETAVEDEQEAAGTLRWDVTFKLRNVAALRQLAAAAAPQEAGRIADDFAVAWSHAIDSFAPIRSVPGIDWQPGSVELAHQPARPGR